MIKRYPVLGGLILGVGTALISAGIPVRAAAPTNPPRAATMAPATSMPAGSSTGTVRVGGGATGTTGTTDPTTVSEGLLVSNQVSGSSLARVSNVDGRALENPASAVVMSRSIPTAWPVAGRISSIYTPHRMHPILGRYAPHYGLDIAAPYGTPIHATADGVVVALVDSRSYGLGIDISHGNGYITRYAHASRLLVYKGQRVRQGDVIAYVGSTGLSTGPHCHYEVFHNGWSIDPASLMAH